MEEKSFHYIGWRIFFPNLQIKFGSTSAKNRRRKKHYCNNRIKVTILVAQLVKNLPANGGGGLGSILGLGRYPGEGKGYPLQYSGLENSMGLQRVGHDWATFTFLHRVLHTIPQNCEYFPCEYVSMFLGGRNFADLTEIRDSEIWILTWII